MPITEAKAREWAGIDPVSQIFPILLHCCLTVADMREMLPIILAFAHLFIPGGEHAPPFAHLAEEFPGVKLCADALVEYEREKILDMASARWPTTLAFGNSKQSEKSFITAISHTEGSKAKVVRTNRMEPFMQVCSRLLNACSAF